MKKILITGANSFIGNAAQKYLENLNYEVAILDMTSDAWRDFDFSSFDSVFHVAGIAHDTGNKKDENLYYKVNYELAVETAQKAKDSKVKQFIFMSSILVYNGVKDRNITINTVPKVKGCYGDSKLQADLALQKMNSDEFKIAVLRPPMIFGYGCKGNFPKLKSLALKLPVFPKIKNRRSMLHIDNLCAVVELIIKNNSCGVFFPQNEEYFCTSDIVKSIAVNNNKKIRLTRIFNWGVWLFYPFISQLKKLFGNLTYSKELSNHFDYTYQIKNNEESLKDS